MRTLARLLESSWVHIAARLLESLHLLLEMQLYQLELL